MSPTALPKSLDAAHQREDRAGVLPVFPRLELTRTTGIRLQSVRHRRCRSQSRSRTVECTPEGSAGARSGGLQGTTALLCEGTVDPIV